MFWRNPIKLVKYNFKLIKTIFKVLTNSKWTNQKSHQRFVLSYVSDPCSAKRSLETKRIFSPSSATIRLPSKKSRKRSTLPNTSKSTISHSTTCSSIPKTTRLFMMSVCSLLLQRHSRVPKPHVSPTVKRVRAKRSP